MKKLLFPLPIYTDIAILIQRLFFGGMFIYYGYGKIMQYDVILPMFGDILHIGSKLSFNLVIFAEFICGIFIFLGLFTRLAVIPTFVTMVVAFFIAHGADSFENKIPAFTYLILSVSVFLFGSGKFSLDALLFKPKSEICEN